jgi:SAM-dependent methyltransferase
MAEDDNSQPLSNDPHLPDLHGRNEISYVVENSDNFFAAAQRLCPLTSEMRILDFGSNTGNIGMRFLGLVGTVAFLDTFAPAIEILKGYLSSQPLTNYEVYSCNIREASAAPFDAVLANLVLHHVENLNETIDCLFSRLKPGGRFIVSELGVPVPPEKLPPNHPPVTFLPPDELISRLTKVGFVNPKQEILPLMNQMGFDGKPLSVPLYILVVEKPSSTSS